MYGSGRYASKSGQVSKHLAHLEKGGVLQRDAACLPYLLPVALTHTPQKRQGPSHNSIFQNTQTRTRTRGGVYRVLDHERHRGVNRRGRARQPIRFAAASTAFSASDVQRTPTGSYDIALR
jgi:hypothetical protein